MEWINCKENLHPVYKEVLVWSIYPDGFADFEKAYLSKAIQGGWEWETAESILFNVTHWMEPTDPNRERRRQKNAKT